MNRNSLRNRPTPTAPEASAAWVSCGSSMFASSSTFWPSSVTEGVLSMRSRRVFSSSSWRWRKRYSSSTIGEGLTSITPASPSMMIQSSCCTSRLAPRAPTIAGMPMLRATMAVCEVLPPTSVTKPLKTLCRNCSMSDGVRSCATSTSGTSAASSSRHSPLRHIGFCMPSSDCSPSMRLIRRSITCSRSALRSRR